MAIVTVERVGELAHMVITRDNGEIIELNLTDIKEITHKNAGCVDVIHMTGTEVPFE